MVNVPKDLGVLYGSVHWRNGLSHSVNCLKFIFLLPMAFDWVGGEKQKILSGLYLRSHEVQEVHVLEGHWLSGVCVQCRGVTLI